MDLFNEVLNIDFGQGAAKILEVKVRVPEKYLPISLVPTHASGSAELADLIEPPTLTSNIFTALDQNLCLVLHLKDQFYICLETKVQGF